MKKAMGIIILGLLLSSNAYAITQQQFIDQNLKGRKLDQIEGVWLTTAGGVFGIYKSGSQYYEITIRSSHFQSGKNTGTFSKGSTTTFYGNTLMEWIDSGGSKIVDMGTTINISGNTWQQTFSYKGTTSNVYRSQRLWPEDIVAHNAKFKTKKDIADEEKVVADMVADARKTCKVLGFEDGSEKFADCTLKLYTQKVDELVAEKQAAYARMTQGQTTTTTQQSSGSNVTTIYDPVRDSRALMKQGQRMLSGACTFGIDC